MKYGLSEGQLNEIIAKIKAIPEIEEAFIFGSRAVGSFKNSSDVDIAIKGEKIDFKTVAHLKWQLEEETYLPFFFDVVAYTTIDNSALKHEIDKNGQRIY
jgi:uncharacterized protein